MTIEKVSTPRREIAQVVAAIHPGPALVTAGVGCAVLAASNDLPNHFALPRLVNPLVALLVFAALVLAFGCFVLAMRACLPRWLARASRWLLLPLLLWALIASAQTVGVLATQLRVTATEWPPVYTSDAMYYDHYAALLVLRGQNPYVGNHLAPAMAYFHLHSGYTPIARGTFQNPLHQPTEAELDAAIGAYLAHPSSSPPEVSPATFHSYPAGAFLVDVPSVWVGIPSAGFAQLLLYLAFGAVLLALAPAEWRIALTLLVLCNTEAVRRIADGDFDIWWVAFLSAAWLLRERRVTSGLLLGAACAIKQTVWFAAPFYLVWVWHEHGKAEVMRRAGIAAGAFLAINLPWILASPRAWLASLVLPMSLPLLPEGTGLVGLSIGHVLPLFPSWIYAALELGVWLGALVWYRRAPPRYPLAGMMLGLLPLLLAWRSPERYFLPLWLVALAAVVLAARNGREPSHGGEAGSGGSGRRASLALAPVAGHQPEPRDQHLHALRQQKPIGLIVVAARPLLQLPATMLHWHVLHRNARRGRESGHRRDGVGWQLATT
jgi:hypothetical protein